MQHSSARWAEHVLGPIRQPETRMKSNLGLSRCKAQLLKKFKGPQGVQSGHQSKRWILRPVFSHDQTTTKCFPSSSLPSAITNPTLNHQQPFIMVPPPNRGTSAPSQFLIMPSNTKTTPSNQGFQVPVIEFGQPIPFLR